METQDGMEVDCTTFDQLISPIKQEVEKIESERESHHREVLGFRAFVRVLLYYFASTNQSGRQLVTDVWSAAPELGLQALKRSTFFDGFNRFPVEWFQRLLGVVLNSMEWAAIPELEALGRLYCIDGSIFPALTKMAWATYTSTHQAVKLHLCFELNRMVPTQFLLEAGNSSERDALRQMLEQDVTYIADRGYVSFQLLADIVAAQAHFVMRMKANLVYQLVEQLPVMLPDSVQHLFTQVTDQRILLSNASGNPIYRLVTFSVGDQLYLILTNRLHLSTFQLILLYAYRWQIELMFKFIKRSLPGLHFLTTSHDGLTIQFYMLLLSALLQLRFKQLCLSIVEPLDNPLIPATDELIAASMSQPRPLSSSRGLAFFSTVGAKLQRYWKISIHWLITLRNFLARPLDYSLILALTRV